MNTHLSLSLMIDSFRADADGGQSVILSKNCTKSSCEICSEKWFL